MVDHLSLVCAEKQKLLLRHDAYSELIGKEFDTIYVFQRSGILFYIHVPPFKSYILKFVWDHSSARMLEFTNNDRATRKIVDSIQDRR